MENRKVVGRWCNDNQGEEGVVGARRLQRHVKLNYPSQPPSLKAPWLLAREERDAGGKRDSGEEGEGCSRGGGRGLFD